jgi:nucleoside-diphosphate-sugar epimerase
MATSVVTSCHTFAVPTRCGTRSGPLLRDDMHPVTSCPVKTSETWTPTDRDSLFGAMDDIDTAIHLAGELTFRGSWEDKTLAANIHGTFNVFDIAHYVGVRKIILASSTHGAGGWWTRIHTTSARGSRLHSHP